MLRSPAVIALLLASTAAYTPTPAAQPRLRTVQPSRAVVATRTSQPPRALLGAASARRQGAALLASATPPPQVLRPAALALKALVSAICSVFVISARAFAAASKSTASASPLALSGDVLKWGGLAAVFGVAYAFRKPETPILVETPPEGTAAPAAELDAAQPTGNEDDLLMSDLRKRMLSLGNEEPEESVPDDSTDEWGTGSTAVLEPPKEDKPGLLDDGPAVDFPVGFPLRDAMGEAPLEPEEPPESTASAEQIAMLERMFGTRSD